MTILCPGCPSPEEPGQEVEIEGWGSSGLPPIRTVRRFGVVTMRLLANRSTRLLMLSILYTKTPKAPASLLVCPTLETIGMKFQAK